MKAGAALKKHTSMRCFCYDQQLLGLSTVILSEIRLSFAIGSPRFFYHVAPERSRSHHILKPEPNDRNMPTQHNATILGATCYVCFSTLLQHAGCCWLKSDHFQTKANNTQHVVTGWPNTRSMLRPTMLREVAPFARLLRTL